MNSGPYLSHGSGGWEIQDGGAAPDERLYAVSSHGRWDLMAR